MYEEFGAQVNNKDVEFRLFFPDNSVDRAQYSRGGLPNIKKIQVTGDFQEKIGGQNWNYRDAPEMKKTAHPKGMLYTCRIPDLPDGFYQYKYYVSFEKGAQRWCTDPCTKYGGSENENSAFVIGGNDTRVRPIARRLPQKDLIIYELMPDDFTAKYRKQDAPFDAVKQRLDYIEDLGVNAVEFMPWTSWPGKEFNWGYEVFQFFAVEYRYINDNRDPLDKLYRLKNLINDLHDRDLHVIMDGVFNHARAGHNPGVGFAYYWLYQDPADSPYTGSFAGGGFFRDLDFGNTCTLEFILDVCKYWFEEYQIDGIRFDYARGYYARGLDAGITRLLQELDNFLETTGRDNVSLMLEHLTDNRYQAIDDTNHTEATGCWFDSMIFEFWDYLKWWNLDTRIMRVLNTSEDYAADKGPITYFENHDHASAVRKAGGRHMWWKTQPYAIALLTTPGGVLIHNGQEYGEDYDIPEDGHDRVKPRPLHWDLSADVEGRSLLGLYKKLISLRKSHPSLRSSNFYPESYEPYFNEHGYGVNIDRDVVIYHRWGERNGRGEKFIIALNFSGYDQWVDIPFSSNGMWEDLLNGHADTVTNHRLDNQHLPSNWGRVYYREE